MFTQTTFSWGDYLSERWEHWVASKRGALFVAEIDHKVVGTVHVRFLGGGEAWLEGLRVHPGFRRRGIASVLIERVHAAAKQRRCRVVRLETGAHNLPAQRAFRKFGYRRVVTYVGFAGGARVGTLDSVRRANLSDSDACWALWDHSWLKRRARGVVPAAFGWRWWEWNDARLKQAVRDKSVWLTPQTGEPSGWMLVREDDSLDVTMLVGSPRAAGDLLGAARAMAAEEDKDEIFWLAPQVVPAAHWAQRAGFLPDETGLLIYERPL